MCLCDIAKVAEERGYNRRLQDSMLAVKTLWRLSEWWRIVAWLVRQVVQINLPALLQADACS
eukprot:5338055-Amphidinium_carterae.1